MPISANLTLRKAWRQKISGRKDEALETLSRAIEVDGADPRLLLRKWLLAGNEADLLSCAEAYPENRAVFFFLALSAYRNGDTAAAGKWLDKAKTISPGNISIKALDALVKLRGEGARYITGMGRELSSATLDVQALALLEAERVIVEKDEKDTGARESEDKLRGPLGWAMDRLDDLAVILFWLVSHTLNAIINISSPKARKAYSHVTEGDRLAGLNRMDEAERRFELALEADPENPEALESLTQSNLEKGDYEKAGAFLDRLESTLDKDAPTPKQWEKWRGEILFLSGRLSEAREIFLKLEDALTLDYFVPYRRGLCDVRSNNPKGAREAFAKALSRVNPGLLAERVDKLENITT